MLSFYLLAFSEDFPHISVHLMQQQILKVVVVESSFYTVQHTI